MVQVELRKKLLKFIRFWLPVILWLVFIYSLSARTVPNVGPTYISNFAAKKTAHIVEYSVLAILSYRAFINYGVRRRNAFFLAVFLCFLYGLTDEFHQSFTPGREPRIRDVLIDTIGGSVGILIIWKLLPKLPVKLRNWAAKLDLT